MSKQINLNKFRKNFQQVVAFGEDGQEIFISLLKNGVFLHYELLDTDIQKIVEISERLTDKNFISLYNVMLGTAARENLIRFHDADTFDRGVRIIMSKKMLLILERGAEYIKENAERKAIEQKIHNYFCEG